MRKKKTFIGLCVAVILVLLIATQGITFGVAGKFYFTTKYYKTAKQAFEHENDTVNFEIKKSVDVLQIDSDNGLYFAVTKDKKLLVAPMLCRNGKFAGGWDHCLYDAEHDDCTENGKLVMNNQYLYHRIKADGTYQWAIVYDAENLPQDRRYQEYTPNGFQKFFVVY